LREIITNLDKKKISRKNILLTCIILTLVSLIFASGSSRFLFKYKLPTENFVTVLIEASLAAPCDHPSDTGFLGTEECEANGPVIIYSTRASAAALKSINGVTYFLTAAHFCDIDYEIERIPPDLSEFLEIERKIYKDEKQIDFEIVKFDSLLDLCLIRANYEISEELILADEMPEVGELAKTISSPLGISEKNVNFHFSGTFSGCNESACFFTIPAIGGSSGSLVLNYDNEVVGITQQSLVGFPEVTIGVGIFKIKSFLREFRDESGIDLL
tara:strand:+ start:2902 stop:3717 length:816 start_codon:yes stop_codon:yes gene_type:complete